ncbi:MAG: 3-deoxy-7-phosphoheptulonate synthase [Chitinophagaceae bacterium]|nr:3-deoxy-7-phosphoheptulonate synthase [Chitinophagaceae bacterium]
MSATSSESLQILWQKRPFIISGPCSAETEDQLRETAFQLKSTNRIDLLRAGIWKPRTKPGLFEGVGAKGLAWLEQVSNETGLPTTVEVANAKQVEEALKHNVSVLWIGARTTVNPFSVQELADALRGVKIPVLIKNPINPDLDLWTGAVERMAGAGIELIGLIHRGFSTFGETGYRNNPLWQLAIEMHLRHPDLLFLTDPSHICGRRDIIPETIQRAIDLGSDGLMIECHRDPDQAWSDAAQQLTPLQLQQIFEKVIWRKVDSSSSQYHTALDALRREINQYDEEVLQILSRRMRVAEKIGQYKKEHQITILQTARWQELSRRVLEKSEQLGLTTTFLTQFLAAIHMESITHQKSVLDQLQKKS